jgi:hypothetical protein
MIAVGDFVEARLSWLGITPKRVEWLLGIKDCGCASRKSALNAWGFTLQYRIMMFFGGPGRLPLNYRLKTVRGRLVRSWKTIISKSITRNGSGGIRR